MIPISNLTSGQRDCLDAMKQIKSGPMTGAQISRITGCQRSWTNRILKSLVESGHLIQTGRGIYDALCQAHVSEPDELSAHLESEVNRAFPDAPGTSSE